MITPTVLIVMLSVTLIALLVIFCVRVTQLKNSNTLLWQEYRKVVENREDEVSELQNRCNGLAERIDYALDVIDSSSLDKGTKVVILALLKKGTLPS